MRHLAFNGPVAVTLDGASALPRLKSPDACALYGILALFQTINGPPVPPASSAFSAWLVGLGSRFTFRPCVLWDRINPVNWPMKRRLQGTWRPVPRSPTAVAATPA